LADPATNGAATIAVTAPLDVAQPPSAFESSYAASVPASAPIGGEAPEAAAEPTTLFDANIDSANVRRVLAELRQGRLSMAEAIASIRASAGQASEGTS
jgi:hypothetical protein